MCEFQGSVKLVETMNGMEGLGGQGEGEGGEGEEGNGNRNGKKKKGKRVCEVWKGFEHVMFGYGWDGMDEEKKEMASAFSLVWDEMEEGGEEGSSRVASSFLRCIAPEAKLIKVSSFASAYTEDASAQGPSRLDGRAGSGFVELSSSSTRSSRASFDLFDTMGLPSPLSPLTAQDPHLSPSTLHLPLHSYLYRSSEKDF